MNFQTPKRIICCLMAALILCCAVIRPLEANASVIALGTLTSVAAVDAIISGMIGLGVVYSSYELLCDTAERISETIPEKFRTTVAGIDQILINAIEYAGQCYVDQYFIEWLSNALSEETAVPIPVYAYDYFNLTSIPNDAKTASDMLDSMLGTDRIPHSSYEQYIVSHEFCHTVFFHPSSNIGPYKGFYFFGNEEPALELKSDYNSYYGGKYYNTALTLTIPDNTVCVWYESEHDYWAAADDPGEEVVFPGAQIYYVVDTAQRVATAVVDEGSGLFDNYTPRIDTDEYKTWLQTGIWIVITDDPQTGNDNNDDGNDNETPKPIPYIPLSTPDNKESMTPEEARSGDEYSVKYTDHKDNVEIYGTGESYEPTNPDGSGDSSDPNDPDQDIGISNIFELLKQFWQDVKNGFANLIEKVSLIWTSVKTIVSTSNSILEAIRGLADLLIPGFVEAFTEAFTGLFKQLAEWLQPLMDYLLEGLKTLFVPKTGYFDAKIELLKAKFPLVNSVLGTANSLKAFLTSLGSTPPVIYIDLSSATGSWYWGAETIFLDLRWYAQYKPTMDLILSAFLWLWFIWRVILALPGIIQGTSGFWHKKDTVVETGMVVASDWYDRR